MHVVVATRPPGRINVRNLGVFNPSTREYILKNINRANTLVSVEQMKHGQIQRILFLYVFILEFCSGPLGLRNSIGCKIDNLKGF